MKRLRFFILVLAFHAAAVPSLPSAHAAWPFKKRAQVDEVIPRENCFELFFKNLFFRYGWFKKASRAVDREPKFFDDLDYLLEWKHKKNYGAVTSEYDESLKTRVYFSPTARPQADGRVARTDGEAGGLVVYLHGSGTMKANGSTFNHKVSRLNAAGFSTLSFDLPFHRDGPQIADLTKKENFLAWVLEVVNRHRKAGQPVVIAGHSGGATIVGELVARYPEAFDGAVMLSPAGFNKELKTWYQKHTLEFLKSQKDIEINKPGARWGFMVERQFSWMKKGRIKAFEQPGARLPKMRILTGEYEEFVPGPIDAAGMPMNEPRTYDLCLAMKKIFPFAICTVEPGIGHRLNNHIDKDGKDVVIREILEAFGPDVAARAKAGVQARKQSRIHEFAQDFAADPYFAGWVRTNKSKEEIAGLFARNDEKLATAILKEFNAAVQVREKLIWEAIRSTETHSPEFYAKYQTLIAEVGKSPNKKDQLYSAYLDHLETLAPEHPLRKAVDPDLWEKRIREITAARKNGDNGFASPEIQAIFADRKARKAAEGELKTAAEAGSAAFRELATRDVDDPKLAADFAAAIETLGAHLKNAERFAGASRDEAETVIRVLGEGSDPAKQAIAIRDAAERMEARVRNMVETFKKLVSVLGRSDSETILLVRQTIEEDPIFGEKKAVVAWFDRLALSRR